MKQILLFALMIMFASVTSAQVKVVGPVKIAGPTTVGGTSVSTPTFVQLAYAEQGGSGTTSVNLTSTNSSHFAWANNFGANNWTVCAVNNSATTTAQSLTFSPSLTVTGLTGNPFPGANTTTFFTAPTGAGGANTNTTGAWTTSSSFDSMPCAEYTAVNLTTPVDTGGSAICSSFTLVGSGPVTISCNVITTGTNERIITFCAMNISGSAMAVGAGETLRIGNATVSPNLSAIVNNGVIMMDMAAPTAGSYTTSCTTSSAPSAGGIVSFAFNH